MINITGAKTGAIEVDKSLISLILSPMSINSNLCMTRNTDN